MRSRALISCLVLPLILAVPVAAQDAEPAGACAGWTTRVVAEGLGSLENIEPDGTGGMLISATARNAVERLLPDGSVGSTVAADMPAPGGLRVRDGVLFANTGDSAVDGAAGNTNGTIERIDLATGERETYTSGLTMPNGLVFDGDGNAYTSRDVGMPSYITKVPVEDPQNPDTEWADLADTNGMVIDPSGELIYVVTTFNAPASVFSVRLDDPTQITEIAQLQQAGGPNPAKGLDDLTIDDDGILYITANGSGELLRLDPISGEACLITGDLQNPSAVKFGAGPGWSEENLYVSAFDGRVVEVIPPSGTGQPDDGDADDGDAGDDSGGDGSGGGGSADGGSADGGLVDFACPARSWVAGTSELCGGVLTYRDYVYDDYGADLGVNNARSTGTLSQPAGDVRYPEAGPHNTADIIDISFRVRPGEDGGDHLEVVAELSAVFASGDTILGVAIDTDDDASTGGGELPDFGASSAGWDELHTFTDVDVLANLIGGSVPAPDSDRWRVQAFAAQARPEGDAVDMPIMNVAFRGPDEQSKFTFLGTAPSGDGAWFEDDQAAALAAGDISQFGQVVDVSDLRPGGRTAQLDEVRPGLHERVYTSDVTLPPGEGYDYTGIPGRGTGGPSGAFGQEFDYYGRYQPYGIYLPDQAGPHGLAMIYHGSNQNHSQLVNLPNLQQQVAETHNRLMAAPLARGVHGYGSDISERDLQDVRADVESNYDIDQNKVIAAGYSQGGYVTFRQAALRPDEYSAFITWVGFTGDDANPAPNDIVTAGAVGNMFDFVRNYRHVPGGMIFGGADELIPVTSSEGMANEFRTRDFPYSFWMHPTGDHFAFALLDEWTKESDFAAQWDRVTDPAHVEFRTGEVLGWVDAGTRHDRAYWVSQIRGRESVVDPFAAEDAYIDVDLLTQGCGGEIPEVSLTPGAGEAPIPWVSDEHVVTGSTSIEDAPRLTGSLVNVASLAVDVDRACLTGDLLEYEITSDGPTRLRFSDGLGADLDEGVNSGSFTVGPDGSLSSSSSTSAPDGTASTGGSTSTGGSAGSEGFVAEGTGRTGLQQTDRIAGEDRVGTAVAVSRAVHTSADTVIIATGDAYADALAAGPLAALLDAPLLLTRTTGLDDRVAEEIRRLGATTAILAGGESALAPPVAEALTAAGVTVDRVAGEDRFATAALLAARVVEAGGDTTSAYLVEGANADPNRGWPDAVAVSGLAARQGRPILLATRDRIPQPSLEALDSMGATTVTAVGGEASITWRTLAMAAAPGADGIGTRALNRLQGADRYDTSAVIADRTLVDLATTEQVWVVTGNDWPDALAAGPAAAASGGVLLLADGRRDDGGITTSVWVDDHRPIERLIKVGGPAALR